MPLMIGINACYKGLHLFIEKYNKERDFHKII